MKLRWLRENVHLVVAVFWMLLAVPGVTLWRDSVLFVIIISLETAISTRLGAWRAARADRSTENGNG